MFTDTNALNAVAGGPDRFIAGLSAGKTVVDMSTASPAASKAMAAAVRGLGLEKKTAPFCSTFSPSFQEFPHDHRHEDGD